MHSIDSENQVTQLTEKSVFIHFIGITVGDLIKLEKYKG